MNRRATEQVDSMVRGAPEGAPVPGSRGETHPTLHATCEAIGEIIQFWGFKKLTGIVWCYLYLSPAPKSAREIRDDLRLSAGSVSMTLKELLHWGVVVKSTSIGERCQRFTAEADLWKMVSKVLRERDLDQIDRTLETLRASETEYSSRGETAASDELNRFRSERLREMIRAGELVGGLVSKLLTTGRMNIRPLWPFILGSLGRPRGGSRLERGAGIPRPAGVASRKGTGS